MGGCKTLRRHLEDYTPEKAGAICEIHQDNIRQLARKVRVMDSISRFGDAEELSGWLSQLLDELSVERSAMVSVRKMLKPRGEALITVPGLSPMFGDPDNLESDLLINMAGIQTRWADPLVIEYPQYLTWFDFPFGVWMGPETSAQEKNAALVFQQYLLSEAQQQKALARGLRPANLEVSLEDADSLFVRWQDQGAMTQLPRFTRMRSPDRDVLLALLRWFDLNVAQ